MEKEYRFKVGDKVVHVGGTFIYTVRDIDGSYFWTKEFPTSRKLMSNYVKTNIASMSDAETQDEEKEAIVAFKITFKKVEYTELNGVKVDSYDDEDLVNFIRSGADEVTRIKVLAEVAGSKALATEANDLAKEILKVGKILDERAQKRLDEAAKAE